MLRFPGAEPNRRSRFRKEVQPGLPFLHPANAEDWRPGPLWTEGLSSPDSDSRWGLVRESQGPQWARPHAECSSGPSGRAPNRDDATSTPTWKQADQKTTAQDEPGMRWDGVTSRRRRSEMGVDVGARDRQKTVPGAVLADLRVRTARGSVSCSSRTGSQRSVRPLVLRRGQPASSSLHNGEGIRAAEQRLARSRMTGRPVQTTHSGRDRVVPGDASGSPVRRREHSTSAGSSGIRGGRASAGSSDLLLAE